MFLESALFTARLEELAREYELLYAAYSSQLQRNTSNSVQTNHVGSGNGDIGTAIALSLEVGKKSMKKEFSEPPEENWDGSTHEFAGPRSEAMEKPFIRALAPRWNTRCAGKELSHTVSGETMFSSVSSDAINRGTCSAARSEGSERRSWAIVENEITHASTLSRQYVAIRLIDIEADEGAFTRVRVACFKIVSSNVFEGCMSLFVIADCILIGIDAQNTLNPFIADKTGLVIAALILSTIFILELALRIAAYGAVRGIQNRWMQFDMWLVAMSVIDYLLLLNVSGHVDFVRAFRCARLARLAKLLVSFPTLWYLVMGLKASVSVLIATGVLLGLISYMFAVIGMMAFPPQTLNHDSYYNQVASDHFGSLPDAMITLLQFATFDASAAIYRPMVTESDKPYQAAVFFILYMMIVSVALMNLVTALMVDASIRHAEADREHLRIIREAQRRNSIPKIQDTFMGLDKDGTGEISFAEIQDAPEQVKNQLKAIFRCEHLEEIFELIDDDGSGTLDINEFLNTMCRATGDQGAMTAHQSLQMARVLKQTRQIMDEVQKIKQHDLDRWSTSSVTNREHANLAADQELPMILGIVPADAANSFGQRKKAHVRTTVV